MRYFLIGSLLLFLIACSGDTKNDSESSIIEETKKELPVVEEMEDQVVEVEAVCILDELSIRDAPYAKGKYLGALRLGEKVAYLGEAVIDSASSKKHEYFKLRLVDGKEGWARSDFIVENGIPATVVSDADVYSRPDLLTKKSVKYSAMDIVAVFNGQSDWVEVKGKRNEGKWIETGWIRKKNLSYEDVDIASGIYARRALNLTDNEKKIEAIKDILSGDFSSSIFVPMLEERLENLEYPHEEGGEGHEYIGEEHIQEVAKDTVQSGR